MSAEEVSTGPVWVPLRFEVASLIGGGHDESFFAKQDCSAQRCTLEGEASALRSQAECVALDAMGGRKLSHVAGRTNDCLVNGGRRDSNFCAPFLGERAGIHMRPTARALQ